jgi:hypothetical protein
MRGKDRFAMKIIGIYAVSWLGMVVLAILNGAVREKLYRPWMSELSAHQVSTVVGICLFGVYIWLLTGFWRIESSVQAWGIGIMWLVMTVAFEFLFGHFVMGHPWGKLFQDYNLLRGRLWPLVLAWTAIAPFVFFRIRS